MAKVTVDKELCKSCELCFAACPFKLLAFSEDINSKGYRYAEQRDAEKCTGCKLCAILCPDAAISVYK